MKQMEEKIFREFLEKKGCKFTKERAAILSEVFSNHGHFDPEDLFFKIREKGSEGVKGVCLQNSSASSWMRACGAGGAG